MVSQPNALYDALQLDLSYPGSKFFPGMSVSEAASIHLSNNFLKKLESSSSDADSNAIKKFIEVNERMRTFKLEKDSWSELETLIYNTMKNNLYRALYTSSDCKLNPTSILSRLDTGPGASLGIKATDFYSKIGESTLSTTSTGLYTLYRAWTKANPVWDESETYRFDHFGKPEVVVGSKLSTVPKNVEISRTICTEPLLNMMFQKGIGSILENVLRTSLHVVYTSQEDSPTGLLQPDKNRMLARLGSIDNSFATIDLSSASDSISITLLRDLLPKAAFSWLMCCRSPVTTLPNKEVVDLHMISSMGNGFTFPLQTLIFGHLVRSVYECLDLEIRYPSGERIGNFGVFGDDIIVVKDAALLVLKMLRLLGFLPNIDKTFVDGDFKESCGFDYYKGVNIRPVFLRKIKTLQDKFVLYNRIQEYESRTGLNLTHTKATLLEIIGSKRTYVPMYANDDEGIRSTLDVALDNGVARVQDRNSGAWGFLYHHYTPRIVSIELLDGCWKRDNSTLFNYSAAKLAFYRGNLRNDCMTLRSSVTQYRFRPKYTPTW